MTLLKYHHGGLILPDKHAEPNADLAGLEEVMVAEYDPRKEKTYVPVFDQSKLGSCTANADAFCFERDMNLDGHRTGRLSRLFVYYGEREIEGNLGQGDTGAYGSDGFKVAATKGVCKETDWPYDISTFENPPTAKMLADALKTYVLKKKTSVVPQTTSAIKKVLSNKQTISFGFKVYESFEEQAYWTESPGDDPNIMAAPQGNMIGGHQIVLIGFLEKYPYHIIARNSWSKGWQKDGHFLFPIKHLTNHNMCSDFTTIVRPL